MFDSDIVRFALENLWWALLFGHILSGEQSRGRRVLLKIFARWIEVPILWFIWVACDGPLAFLTRNKVSRVVLGTLVTRPFGKYIDTGVPVPRDHVLKMIDSIDGPIAVGDCRCRLAKKTCDHPMLTDIVFRTGAEAWLWAFPDNYRVIDKKLAKEIVTECSRLGMFQMVFIHCSTASHVNEYVVCNCCSCGCKPHLLNRTVGQSYFPLPDGGFRSFADNTKCDLCEACVTACPFDAISLADGGVKIEDCYGCGICELVCEKGVFEVRQVHPGPPWAQDVWNDLDSRSSG